MPKLKFFSHCTEYPPQDWCYPPLYWCYPLHVVMLSPQCTEYPPQYWNYPPLYWFYPPLYLTTSAVLKVFPTALKVSPHVLLLSLQYWRYQSTVLNTPHITYVIPHCTEQPPQYWSYPPQYWCCSPDVLNSLQCTEQPPLHWTDIKWSECCCKLKESREGRNGSGVLRSKTRVWNEARMGQGQRKSGLVVILLLSVVKYLH